MQHFHLTNSRECDYRTDQRRLYQRARGAPSADHAMERYRRDPLSWDVPVEFAASSAAVLRTCGLCSTMDSQAWVESRDFTNKYHLVLQSLAILSWCKRLVASVNSAFLPEVV